MAVEDNLIKTGSNNIFSIFCAGSRDYGIFLLNSMFPAASVTRPIRVKVRDRGREARDESFIPTDGIVVW